MRSSSQCYRIQSIELVRFYRPTMSSGPNPEKRILSRTLSFYDSFLILSEYLSASFQTRSLSNCHGFHRKNSSGISARGEKTPLTGHLLCQGRIKTLDPRYHPLGGLSRENSKPCISSHSVKFHPVVDLQKAGQHLRACRSPWTRHETAGPCSGPGNGGWAREDHPTAGVGTAPPGRDRALAGPGSTFAHGLCV